MNNLSANPKTVPPAGTPPPPVPPSLRAQNAEGRLGWGVKNLLWTISLTLVFTAAYWIVQIENLPALSERWSLLRAWGSFHLALVSENSPLLWVLTPAMLMAAWA